tara:strand:+ start:120 stop:473 length:354 start_codon:yes stop_codon:yes gene_type:complete
MAYFTKLNDQNIVQQVIVVHDDVATDEQAGITFLTNLYNYSNWKQTYKDGTRKNYAGKGYTYDSDKNAFIEPQPFNSWTLDNDTCRWIAPVAYPSDASQERQYDWNEEITNWVLIER